MGQWDNSIYSTDIIKQCLSQLVSQTIKSVPIIWDAMALV